jgi:hypothetical protein
MISGHVFVSIEDVESAICHSIFCPAYMHKRQSLWTVALSQKKAPSKTSGMLPNQETMCERIQWKIQTA